MPSNETATVKVQPGIKRRIEKLQDWIRDDQGLRKKPTAGVVVALCVAVVERVADSGIGKTAVQENLQEFLDVSPNFTDTELQELTHLLSRAGKIVSAMSTGVIARAKQQGRRDPNPKKTKPVLSVDELRQKARTVIGDQKRSGSGDSA